MKNIRNMYSYDSCLSNKFYNRKKSRSLCRSIAEEKLTFKDGTELGALLIAIEDGATKRKVRRIVEKRVCKEYWKARENSVVSDNKHRSAMKKYVASVMKKIFGGPMSGFHYVAA